MRKLPKEKSRIKKPGSRRKAPLHGGPAHQDRSRSGESADQCAKMSAMLERRVYKQIAHQRYHSDDASQSIYIRRQVKGAGARYSHTKVKCLSWADASARERTISGAAHLSVVEPLEILIECGCTARDQCCTEKSVEQDRGID